MNFLFIGYKNGYPVKIKVKEIGCHGAISLTPVKESIQICTELIFNSLKNLKAYQAKSENTIYIVDNNGTIEQYMFNGADIFQISGDVNNSIDGNNDIESDTEVSPIETGDLNGKLTYNLPELENGDYRYKNKELTEVISDMPRLKSAKQMFFGCRLKYFAGNLGSLEKAENMFRHSLLDEESITNIVDGIKDMSSSDGALIDIGFDSTAVTMDKLEKLDAEFDDKGWSVKWYRNGGVALIEF